MKKLIYMDHAAATPLDNRVLEKMQLYFSDKFYNPSALYLAAKDVSRDIATARQIVAECLGARSSEVFFVAGGTEANNLAIHGVMKGHLDSNIVVSTMEHDSVMKPANEYDCRTAPVLANGRIDMNQLEQCIDDKTLLVSIMYVNNEIGTVQPIKRISKLITKLRQWRKNNGNSLPLFFHVDACQAPLYLDLHVERLGVDLMTINGGKIYGPKQSGVLYVRSGTVLEPHIFGGGQESGIRSGTENVSSIIGLTEALRLAQIGRVDEVARLRILKNYFLARLNMQLPSVQINGSVKYRSPSNVHVTLPDTDNERLIMALDEAGVLAAAGSACSASSEEPSHVLKAIGLSDKEAQSSLRFTMGRSTTKKDIHVVVDTITRLVV